MLTIERAIVEAIIEHARNDHPDEACGLVVGPAGSDRPVRFIPMENADHSMTSYHFDTDEFKAVYDQMWDRDEEAIVIYHSHTATEAYPSRTDVARADEYAQLFTSPHYVLVSTRAPEAADAELSSYRITNGEITPEDVHIV
jgi:proteasome lid subunit RPN8/RPN11